MKYWFRILIGLEDLPDDAFERAQFLQFADAHHVLGQFAVSRVQSAKGKTRDVLENALFRSSFDSRMLAFEMNRVERAFLRAGIVPILLKGAAYVATGSEAGKGRRVSDIDILVEESELEKAEALLLDAGWKRDSETDNPYDQQYYRDHMHELPPFRHAKRRTVIDVHHQLLPRTARIKIDAEILRASAENMEGRKLKVFTQQDLFIHATVHAFADGAFDTPMRTMLELWHLLGALQEADDKQLLERIKSVGASKPASLAFYMLWQLTGDRRAENLLKQSDTGAPWLSRKALFAKFNDPANAWFAKSILYLRSHYLRMSLPMLVRHLLVKLGRRLRNIRATEE